MALAFSLGASEWFARRASAERRFDGRWVGLSLCGSYPSAGRTASRGVEALRASVMDYRRLLMSRVVPGQFDDADCSDRWAPVGHPDSVGILLSPSPAPLRLLRETGGGFVSFSIPAGSFIPVCCRVNESHLSKESRIG